MAKMASDDTDQSVMNITEDHLQCPICTNRFRQPKVLDCLHTFCLKCLQDRRRNHESSRVKLTCPVCGRETTLEGTGVIDLPDSSSLNVMVEEARWRERILGGQGSEIKCQACDDENQAISRCMDCAHFLCQECQRAHKRMTVMKSHQISTLTQLRSGEIVYTSDLRQEVPKCGKHPDQTLSVYCNTCEQVICTTCSIEEHEHPMHNAICLPQALEQFKKSIMAQRAQAEENHEKLITVMQETDESRKKLDSAFAAVKEKISTKARQEIDKIQEEERRLTQELQESYRDRATRFDTAQDINRCMRAKSVHTLREVSRLMTQASSYEILSLKPQILANLKLLTTRTHTAVADDRLTWDFEEGELTLGRLVLSNGKLATGEDVPPIRPIRAMPLFHCCVL